MGFNSVFKGLKVYVKFMGYKSDVWQRRHIVTLLVLKQFPQEIVKYPRFISMQNLSYIATLTHKLSQTI